MALSTLPQCSHITRKRGVYYWRRRLPGRGRGEVALSLATRRFREAEHRAEMLNVAFGAAWERAMAQGTGDRPGNLGAILREHLREHLDRDLERRLQRPPGSPVYAHWWEPGDKGTGEEADLAEIRMARDSLAADLARNNPDDLMRKEADRLMAQHGLPEGIRGHLVAGLHEAAMRAWDVAERRTLGTEPLVFSEAGCPVTPSQTPDAFPPPRLDTSEGDPAAPNAKPLASRLVEPFFTRREKVDGATHQVMNQDRGTLRRFIECAGDLPMDSYGRGEVSAFLDTMRRLPATYGKSPTDKGISLADLIARADATGAPRLSDKTIKRHLSALVCSGNQDGCERQSEW